jgi:hypothetical protein
LKKKTLVAMVGVTAEIRTGILWNTSLNHQYSSQVALNYTVRSENRCALITGVGFVFHEP